MNYLRTAEVLVLYALRFSFSYTAGSAARILETQTDSSVLVVFKYDTYRHLTEKLELPPQTKDAHVPDTGHIHQPFSSSFPEC